MRPKDEDDVVTAESLKALITEETINWYIKKEAPEVFNTNRRKLSRSFSIENPESDFLQVSYGISSNAFKSKVVYDPFVNRWKEEIIERIEGDDYHQFMNDFVRSAFDMANNF